MKKSIQLFKGICPKCKKVLIEDETNVVFVGSPPEFPVSIKGHCGLAVEMDYYNPTRKEQIEEMGRYEDASKNMIRDGLKKIK